ncbi:SAM-dependent methyltransferase [Luteolibacter sp. SL250]|uniref:class I SAM-dependent methyltransferase n=1 Tax=Luteolibacter sp. SL250 TaxID=2995170 RepID=UPI0022707F27|nr:SAM-dependent methyltransferase [Luteolibacter sp. SL250]WAC19753.1 SAM-dependent methyltransferase [Luteolibacter sp. SL250]
MPDFRSPPPEPTETLPNLYPTGDAPATPALLRVIGGKIASSGTISFPEFMSLALYHPEHGYYAKDLRQVGREGDFFTSVSVGPLFGRILARRFIAWWEENQRPSPWRVIEAGAHDGTLAGDILTEISSVSPAAFSALEYAIPEPLPRLQAAQREKLAPWGNVRFVNSPEDLAASPLPGIAFGNEVLDALPFEIIGRSEGGWHEFRVGLEDEKLTLIKGPPYPHGPEGVFPDGYLTEIRRDYGAFFLPFLGALRHGLLVWVDYGYDHETYYHPDRTTGTLRTFSKHRAGENPLNAPGDEDITAHVDFTAAADAALALGCRINSMKTQSAWLTEAARDLLLSMEGRPDPSLLRQFQTLTHPGQLGTRFHVLEASWHPG